MNLIFTPEYTYTLKKRNFISSIYNYCLKHAKVHISANSAWCSLAVFLHSSWLEPIVPPTCLDWGFSSQRTFISYFYFRQSRTISGGRTLYAHVRNDEACVVMVTSSMTGLLTHCWPVTGQNQGGPVPVSYHWLWRKHGGLIASLPTSPPTLLRPDLYLG